MKDFFKYTNISEEDKNWGMYINSVGKSCVQAGINYPSSDHPSGYYFTWDKGRILNEYQINYITEGSGTLETKNGKYTIKSGSLMIIRKDEWHRYRPTKSKGWTEHYIGFDGNLAHHFLEQNPFLKEQVVIHCEVRVDLIDTYYKIFELIKNEDPGNQHIASGLLIQLFGYIVAWQKQRNFSGKPIEKIIQQSRFYMRNNVEGSIDLKKMAEDHCIGYSYYRKMFKKYTGIAPHQYYLDLKLIRAKELILTTDKNIKEISYELGFQSVHYFSRLFKKKMGQNPSQLKEMV